MRLIVKTRSFRKNPLISKDVFSIYLSFLIQRNATIQIGSSGMTIFLIPLFIPLKTNSWNSKSTLLFRSWD